MIVEYLTQFFENIMEILTQGGIITYIILFIGIYGLLVSLRKIVYLKKISKVDTTEILGIVSSSMERGGAVEALKQINSFKNPISKIISETLKIGDEVVAIFKSSTVLITTDITLNISARNKFQGTVDSINQDEINTELVIDIGNNDKIASVITSSSFERLKIEKGTQVSAIIKASDVIIGK